MLKKILGFAGKKAFEYIKPKVNIPQTNIQKEIRNLKIGNQKLKGKKAKLDQTLFEIENPKFKGKDFTFKKEYDRVTKKATGGRVGLKKGSFPDLSGDGKTTMKDILIGRGVIKNKKGKKKMIAKKFKSPMERAIKKDKKKII